MYPIISVSKIVTIEKKTPSGQITAGGWRFTANGRQICHGRDLRTMLVSVATIEYELESQRKSREHEEILAGLRKTLDKLRAVADSGYVSLESRMRLQELLDQQLALLEAEREEGRQKANKAVFGGDDAK